MTILPGSLDYLYYNDILEHIPYEAYEMGMVSPANSTQNRMNNEIESIRNIKHQEFNGNQAISNSNNMQNINNSYNNTIQKGQMHDYYTSSNGYSNSTIYSQQMGSQSETRMSGQNNGRGLKILSGNKGNGAYNKYDRRLQQNDGDIFKSSIDAESKGAKEGVMNSHPFLKGLAAVTIIIATPILLIRRLAKPRHPQGPSAGNSRGWFRKKSSSVPSEVENNASTKRSFWSKLNPKNWFK